MKDAWTPPITVRAPSALAAFMILQAVGIGGGDTGGCDDVRLCRLADAGDIRRADASRLIAS